jgi:hypothetical protein
MLVWGNTWPFISNVLPIFDAISGWIRPVFFITFFVLTAIAYRFRDEFHLRQTYVCVLLISLLVVNIAGVHLLPIATLHKFQSVGPEERTLYELRVVDANGNELPYDARAASPLPGSQVNSLSYHSINVFNQAEREELAKFLFRRAQQYRQYVESNPFVRSDFVKFPRYGLDYRWNQELLSKYVDFVGLRIYERHVVYSAEKGGVSKTNELVFEWYNGNETVAAFGID